MELRISSHYQLRWLETNYKTNFDSDIKRVVCIACMQSMYCKVNTCCHLSELKFSLVCDLRNMVKCSQALSNWIKKTSLFCFCKFLCLLDLRICFCLKRGRPWLVFSIKFNRYSRKSFQRELVGFSNAWIQFIFRDFDWVLMSKILSPPLHIFSRSRGNHIFFQFHFCYMLE